MPLHLVKAVRMTQRMGSMSTRDWTWTCSQNMLFSYLYSPHRVCLFFSRKSQAQGALPVLRRNYSSLDSCVPYKHPPEKEEAGRAVHTWRWPVACSPIQETSSYTLECRVQGRAGMGFHFPHSCTRKGSALSHQPGFGEVRQPDCPLQLGK